VTSIFEDLRDGSFIEVRYVPGQTEPVETETGSRADRDHWPMPEPNDVVELVRNGEVLFRAKRSVIAAAAAGKGRRQMTITANLAGARTYEKALRENGGDKAAAFAAARRSYQRATARTPLAKRRLIASGPTLAIRDAVAKKHGIQTRCMYLPDPRPKVATARLEAIYLCSVAGRPRKDIARAFRITPAVVAQGLKRFRRRLAADEILARRLRPVVEGVREVRMQRSAAA
jgi:hypothetical protein